MDDDTGDLYQRPRTSQRELCVFVHLYFIIIRHTRAITYSRCLDVHDTLLTENSHFIANLIRWLTVRLHGVLFPSRIPPLNLH